MKKLILSTLAVLAAMGLHAQLLKVESMERVCLPQGVRAEQAILSPDGNSIALSDLDGSLKVVDRRSGTARTISRTGSMMDLAFTADGIVFREASTDGQRRRHVAVKSYRLSDGRTTELVAPSRNLQTVAVGSDGSVLAVESGRMYAAGNAVSAEAVRPVPSIDHGLLYLNYGSTRTAVCPLGTDGMSYLWPSVSPDGNSLLFFAAGYGTYTCSLDGSNLRHLGWLYAPVWYDNSTVVGMRTANNGVVTTEGHIIATAADGSASQTLTEDNLIAVLPSATPGQISFTTTEGEMYIMNVKSIAR